MTIVIYYLTTDGTPAAKQFLDSEFSAALKRVQSLREEGMTHVIMSNEPANMVGKPGVSSVENGKTPDGEDYGWSKAGRAGRVRHLDRSIFNDGELVRPKPK